MSAQKPPAPSSATSSYLIGGAGIFLAIALALWSSWGAGVRLDRSAAGFEGLAVWLKASGIEARMFRGGDALTRERVGLRVLPLHDADLDLAAEAPQDKRAQLLAETERDIDRVTVRRKAIVLPTLVVLPKWRAGVRSLETAHPDLLIAARSAARTARQALDQSVSVERLGGWTERSWSAIRRAGSGAPESPGAVRLYHAQLLYGSNCETLLGFDGGMLLGRCSVGRNSFLLLSDPDLLNNHGLSQGDNARLAAAFFRERAEGKPVLVDATTRVWASGRRRAPPRERSWADLARFFEPPFEAMWIGFGMMAALALWRAWVRDRAPIPPKADGVEASRAAAIDAKARLLRLSGHDAELTRAHIADRLQALAAEALGPHRAMGAAGIAQLRRALARRSHKLALDLDDFSRADAPAAGAPASELLAHLDRFDQFADAVREGLSLGRSGSSAGRSI